MKNRMTRRLHGVSLLLIYKLDVLKNVLSCMILNVFLILKIILSKAGV